MPKGYEYVKFDELDLLRNKTVNIYGKIHKIIPGFENQWTLELKDEKGIITAILNGVVENFKFEVNQIVRIHRALVLSQSYLPVLMVNVGKSGCHFVVWPPDGENNPDFPEFSSSKNWTKEHFDKKYLKKLNRLEEKEEEDDRGGAKTPEIPSTSVITPEQENIDERELLYRTICDNLLEEGEMDAIFQRFIDSIPPLTQSLEMSYLFELGVGDVFCSGLFYETEPLEYSKTEVSLQWTVHCPRCESAVKQFPYIQRGKAPGKCHFCKKPLFFETSCHLSIRIQTISPGYNVIYTVSMEDVKELNMFSRENLYIIWKMKAHDYEEWCRNIYPGIEEYLSSVRMCCSEGVIQSKLSDFKCIEIYVSRLIIQSKPVSISSPRSSIKSDDS